MRNALPLEKYWSSLLILLLLGSAVQAQDKILEVELNKRDVPVLTFKQPEVPRGDKVWRVTLLRSTMDLERDLDWARMPVARFPQNPQARNFIDREAPEGVYLYYQLKIDTEKGKKLYSNVGKIACPKYPAGFMEDPYILVDKLRYALLVYDGETLMRSLPMVLGRSAENRKLHFDRASTPEGMYRVSAKQPRATFYRAFDINYPNRLDETRLDFYEAAKLVESPAPDIGGEIQIHGHGIHRNWTWGCIAMRDSDMDWLFSIPEFRVGLPVYIAGSEITPKELKYLRHLPRSEKKFYTSRLQQLGYDPAGSQEDFDWALCQFQLDSNLVVTGLLDEASRKKLGPWRR